MTQDTHAHEKRVKYPCKKQACAIQACLVKHQFNNPECQADMKAFLNCCQREKMQGMKTQNLLVEKFGTSWRLVHLLRSKVDHRQQNLQQLLAWN